MAIKSSSKEIRCEIWGKDKERGLEKGSGRVRCLAYVVVVLLRGDFWVVRAWSRLVVDFEV